MPEYDSASCPQFWMAMDCPAGDALSPCPTDLWRRSASASGSLVGILWGRNSPVSVNLQLNTALADAGQTGGHGFSRAEQSPNTQGF